MCPIIGRTNVTVINKITVPLLPLRPSWLKGWHGGRHSIVVFLAVCVLCYSQKQLSPTAVLLNAAPSSRSFVLIISVGAAGGWSGSGSLLQWLAWIHIVFLATFTAVWVVNRIWYGPVQRLCRQLFRLRSFTTTQSPGFRSWSGPDAGGRECVFNLFVHGR